MPLKIHYRDDGVGLLEVDEFRFPLFILSRRRERILLNNPLMELSNVVIDEDEYDSYQAAFKAAGRKPLSLLTHHTYGCSKIRNHIVDHWYRPSATERFNFQVDDDFLGLRYIFGFRARTIDDPGYICSVMAHVGRCALDAGTALFYVGGSIMGPRERMSNQPFVIRRWAKTGFFGWIDPDLRMDENLITSDDLDLALQALAKKKVIWDDIRWLTIHDAEKGRMRGLANGDSVWITDKLIRQEQAYLQRKWGAHIIHLGYNGWRPGQGYEISVTVPQTYEESRPEKAKK